MTLVELKKKIFDTIMAPKLQADKVDLVSGELINGTRLSTLVLPTPRGAAV